MKQYSVYICIIVALLSLSYAEAKQKQIQFQVAYPNVEIYFPVDMDYYSNNVYVTSLGGQIYKFANSDAVRADQVEAWFDIYSAPVDFYTNWFLGGDDGITSFEFHPQYPTVPKFYTFYSSSETSIQVTAWTVNNGAVDYSSADVLLTIPKAAPKVIPTGPDSVIYEAYLGGDLRFLKEEVPSCGSDSDSDSESDEEDDKRRGSSSYVYNLYISVGDGNDLEAVQDLGNLLGKILRITPNRHTRGFTIPCNNPFVAGQFASGADEIYARGVRNPRKMVFSADDDDDDSGNLFIGDVGVDFDEVNRLTNPGKNLGWPHLEGCQGASSNSQYTFPIYTYTSTEGPHTVTLGPYYPSNGPIKSLRGRVIFADLYSGALYSIQTSNTRECNTSPTLVANGPAAISAFTMVNNVITVANVFGAFYGLPNFYRVVEV